jgi:hypothetical protein
MYRRACGSPPPRVGVCKSRPIYAEAMRRDCLWCNPSIPDFAIGTVCQKPGAESGNAARF